MHLASPYKVLTDGEEEYEDGDEDEEEVFMIEEDIGDGATTGDIFDTIDDIFKIILTYLTKIVFQMI